MTDRNQVRMFSFISGQEVVGEASFTDGGWTVKRPFAVVMRPNPNGQGGSLGLVPWPMLADENDIKNNGITIYADVLAASPYKPNSQLLDGYMSQVSGLVMPQSSPIILTETN